MNLATIVKIKSLAPIESADRIELAEMHGNAWKCVVKKNDFRVNDLGVYFALDSIVDKNNPKFSFLAQHNFRIKNAKFKKTPSQGLLMPLSVLSYYEKLDLKDMILETSNGIKIKLIEGLDVSDICHVKKYEKEIPAELRGKIKGNFPTSLIPITDELNLLSYPNMLEEFNKKEVYISLKADGSSLSFFYQNGDIKVCSRKLDLEETDGNNAYWKVFNQYNLREKLNNLKLNISAQAEMIGMGIQKNPMKLSNLDMRVFTVRNLDTREYYTLDQMIELCNKLELETVLILDRFIFNKNIHTIEWLQEFANKQEYYKGQWAEGIVLRPVIPEYSKILDRQLSIKILNTNYQD